MPAHRKRWLLGPLGGRSADPAAWRGRAERAPPCSRFVLPACYLPRLFILLTPSISGEEKGPGRWAEHLRAHACRDTRGAGTNVPSGVWSGQGFTESLCRSQNQANICVDELEDARIYYKWGKGCGWMSVVWSHFYFWKSSFCEYFFKQSVNECVLPKQLTVVICWIGGNSHHLNFVCIVYTFFIIWNIFMTCMFVMAKD